MRKSIFRNFIIFVFGVSFGIGVSFMMNPANTANANDPCKQPALQPYIDSRDGSLTYGTPFGSSRETDASVQLYDKDGRTNIDKFFDR